MIGGGDDREDDANFAALFGGETRRLDRGPERVEKRSGLRSRRASDDRARTTAPFRWPDPAERGCAASEGVSDQQLTALRRGEPEPEERIDLHGTRRDAAAALLAKRLESAGAQGLRCVIVIHGRGRNSPGGEAVLKDALPSWLTRGRTARLVQAFAPAPDRLGGEGATLVLLRRSR